MRRHDAGEKPGMIELRIDGEWHLVKDGTLDTLEYSDDCQMIVFSTGKAEMIVDAREIKGGRWRV
jgi:hypothetical protein